MIRKFFLAALFATPFFSNAQQVRPATAAQIYHEIAQLKNLTRVMYLAAHPDDENTRFLAWMVNQKHIRTCYLSLTRGDGGQNILGSEQGAALGLIRTHELIEARKLDGAEQIFTRAIDFGFSKNYEETFRHWNEHQLTRDVVYAIRKFRPDIIICRFPPNAMAGHGQHAASAILAEKAFKLAGDKTAFKDDPSGVQPWQPKRLLFNAFRFGSSNTTTEDMFKLEVGQYNAALGMGYGELAGISRSIHRSQGAGTPSTAGVQTEYFKLVSGDSFSTSLFDGIDISWSRAGRKDIGKHISQILADYDFRHPENSLKELLALRKEIASIDDKEWREEKLQQLDEAILHASGLMAEIVTQKQTTVAGASLPFSLNIISRAKLPVQITNIKWLNVDTGMHYLLPLDTLRSFTHTITIPKSTRPTQPYWMISGNVDAGVFSIPDDSLLSLPETPNALFATISILIDGVPFSINAPLSYKKLDPLKGDVVEQLLITPDISIEISDKLLFTQADGSVRTSIHVHAFKDINDGMLEWYSITGGSDDNSQRLARISLRANTDTLIYITHNNHSKSDAYLMARFTAGGQVYDKTQKLIQYSHLPTLQYFSVVAARIVHRDWNVTVKRIGYIEGAGDYTASLLKLAGLQVDMLKESDLTDAAGLKKYDAIITGIRAVNVEKRMVTWLPVLHQYAANGGTVVMQYNTLQDMATTNIGPYPFTLANLRTTEEDANIVFTDPKHRLLNHPNKITQKDFDGWVQERGLYYPKSWDQHYQTLFEMNDKGEEIQKGSTLYTPYGKGHFIYTSLSLFRQLPAGNRGAIRLLMNMISVGK